MNPRHGEVWLTDLGMAGKIRPVVVMLAEDVPVDRTLIIYVPVTSQARGGPLEISLGHLPFLDRQSVANVQAISALPRVRFEKRLGALPAGDLDRLKKAIKLACAL